MDKVNAILVDFEVPDNWEFANGIIAQSNIDWVIKKCISNCPSRTKWQILKRISHYITFPFSILLNKKKYERIISWQQFYGIFLAYFLQLFHCKKGPGITILTFIFKEKAGLKGKLFRHIVHKAITSRFVKHICVLSSYEIERYAKMFPDIANKLYFCKIGDLEANSICDVTIKKGDYFISAGRSNRDYDFLVQTFSQINEKLFIISDTYKNNNIPANVTILNNCFGDSYKKMMAGCFATIISLGETPISSGQLVILDAARYNKPIIATYNKGIIDYITDGENGILINKNINELINAINKLKNENVYASLAKNSNTYTLLDYGKNIGRLIKDN